MVLIVLDSLLGVSPHNKVMEGTLETKVFFLIEENAGKSRENSLLWGERWSVSWNFFFPAMKVWVRQTEGLVRRLQWEHDSLYNP